MDKPAKVVLFTNSMVMVFNEKGDQIPELQGQYDQVKERIRTVFPDAWVIACYGIFETSPMPFEDLEFAVQQIKFCWDNQERAE
jgi:hypothetical protein